MQRRREEHAVAPGVRELPEIRLVAHTAPGEDRAGSGHGTHTAHEVDVRSFPGSHARKVEHDECADPQTRRLGGDAVEEWGATGPASSQR